MDDIDISQKGEKMREFCSAIFLVRCCCAENDQLADRVASGNEL